MRTTERSVKWWKVWRDSGNRDEHITNFCHTMWLSTWFYRSQKNLLGPNQSRWWFIHWSRRKALHLCCNEGISTYLTFMPPLSLFSFLGFCLYANTSYLNFGFFFFFFLLKLSVFWHLACNAQSCLILCNLMDCSSPGFFVHGIVQGRIVEWIAIPFSKGSSQPRDWTWVSCIAGRFFTFYLCSNAFRIYSIIFWII